MDEENANHVMWTAAIGIKPHNLCIGRSTGSIPLKFSEAIKQDFGTIASLSFDMHETQGLSKVCSFQTWLLGKPRSIRSSFLANAAMLSSKAGMFSWLKAVSAHVWEASAHPVLLVQTSSRSSIYSTGQNCLIDERDIDLMHCQHVCTLHAGGHLTDDMSTTLSHRQYDQCCLLALPKKKEMYLASYLEAPIPIAHCSTCLQSQTAMV